MKYSIIALAALIVAIANSAAGQGTAVPATAEAGSPAIAASRDAPPGLHQRNPRYRLRKGDSFDLDFALSPEFNQTVAVQPDGYVTLKGVGSIFVEGQTVPELTETVKAAYEKISPRPNHRNCPEGFREALLYRIRPSGQAGQVRPPR